MVPAFTWRETAAFDTYNPSVQYKQVLFETGPLPEGAHILRVEAAWTRAPASTSYLSA
ncbi:hypothetical protein [Paenibacillus sp. GYB004]|uniref:hypothetical protein n=1 Tax=Paenibacillus sp. GYB004 TaxID=2994393 RepID=UPI002F968CDC